MKSKSISALLCILLLLCTAVMPAAASDAAAELLSGIASHRMAQSGADSVQEWIDGELTEHAGITSEWYILALSQSREKYDFSEYSAALRQYLAENEITSASTRQKYALALIATGCEDGYISETLADSIGQQGLMSWVFGLHLLHNTDAAAPFTQEQVIGEILSLQLADGGFAITGNNADADATAMTLQALAPHYSQYSAEIDRAVQRLSELQREDGGYASYGVSNPESASQVIIALSCLGIDCMTDARFIKNGNTLLHGITPYRLADGSFCHTLGGTENHNATAQAFLALTAYQMQQKGDGSLFLFEKPEASAVTLTPKVCITIAIIGVGAVCCLVLFFRKKRSIKGFLSILLLTAAGIGVLWFVDIQSAEDYYQNVTQPQNPCGSVTISIRCDTVAGIENAPENTEILPKTEVPISEGDTVFEVLTRAARSEGIRFEYSGSPQMAYIQGIADLYEFDCGDLSGWVYHVNGESPSVGCGECTVSDGDSIEWLYSLDLGNDVK